MQPQNPPLESQTTHQTTFEAKKEKALKALPQKEISDLFHSSSED
mgnify:CR=1 FL=1